MLSHSRAPAVLPLIRSFLNWLIIGVLLLVAYMAFTTFTIPPWHRGEFGADLRLLKSYYAAPQSPGESNYVVDMLRNGHFQEFLKIQGLTNNHALFVLSHGKAVSASSAMRYAFYPDEHVLATARVPYFSARDLAQMMGPRAAKKICNVILAGCNVEGAFDASEIRKYFVNATNITHTPPGKNGYEFVFRHGLIYTSEGVKFFYQMPDNFTVGHTTESTSVYQAKAKLSPYISELFEPKNLKPYKTQVAGRELLGAPEAQRMLAAKTSATQSLSPLSVPFPTDCTLLAEPSKPQSIIMIGAGQKSERTERKRQSSTLMPSTLPIPLEFLGLWRSVVMNALLALALFQISVRSFILARQWGISPGATSTTKGL